MFSVAAIIGDSTQPCAAVSAALARLGGASETGIHCPDPVCLTRRFPHALMKALQAREKISPRLVEIMQNWTHPGFSVFQGERIHSPDFADQAGPSAFRVAAEVFRSRPGR